MFISEKQSLLNNVAGYNESRTYPEEWSDKIVSKCKPKLILKCSERLEEIDAAKFPYKSGTDSQTS